MTPLQAAAAQYREIMWEDLIPPGVPYSEIIGEGEMDEMKDTWKPIFDENGTKLNTALNGEMVKLPGYIAPLEAGSKGISTFILVPYVGACIHVPPPPPNQLVLVEAEEPYAVEELFEPVLVTGRFSRFDADTELAEIGYRLRATAIAPFEG